MTCFCFSDNNLLGFKMFSMRYMISLLIVFIIILDC